MVSKRKPNRQSINQKKLLNFSGELWQIIFPSIRYTEQWNILNSSYLEFVSNNSSQVYPQNTTALFANFFPDKVELNGSWEVVLFAVSHRGICCNIKGGLIKFQYDVKMKQVFSI